ncbi:MAG TPA: redoxin domain-containing protein [Cytophagaceae bacterium]|jgi:thiol-disulfide isomerase/thioredoxin|nr:redoxin domain-containing protein [Cytophagaceae bacterium]
MKLIYAYCILFLLSCIPAFALPPAYSIKIKVKGLKDTVVYLAYHYGDKQYLKDTARIDSKGLFIFDGKEALPGGIYMAVLPDKRYFEFIVSEQFFSLETDTADYVRHMKVTGSAENKLFYGYLQYLYPKGRAIDSLRKQLAKAKIKSDSTAIITQMENIDKDIINYRKDIVKNHPQTFVAKIYNSMDIVQPTQEEKDVAKARKDSLFEFNFYKAHFFDHIDFTDDRIIRTPIFHQKIKEYMSNLTVPTVDSINKSADYLATKAKGNKELFKYVVWYVTTTYETSNLMGSDGVFVHMVEKYYKTKQAYWVDTATLKKIIERADILKPLLIGKNMPNVTLWDSLDYPHTLYSMKARYTIAYFWDPNCGHCQKETPKLYDLYKKYASKGVDVYAVNIDREPKDWKKYVREHKLNWMNVMDNHLSCNFRIQYDIYSTPVIYLLDEKKKIIAKRIGVEQLDEILDSYINNKPLRNKVTKTEEH